MAKDTLKASTSIAGVMADLVTYAGEIKAGDDSANIAQYKTLHRLAKAVKDNVFNADTRLNANGVPLNDKSSKDGLTVGKYMTERIAARRPMAANYQTTYASQLQSIIKAASERVTLVDDFDAVFGEGRVYDKRCKEPDADPETRFIAARKLAKAIRDLEEPATTPLFDGDEPIDIVYAAIDKPGKEDRTPDAIAKAIHTAITNAVNGTKKTPAHKELTTAVWKDALKAVNAAFATMNDPTVAKKVGKTPDAVKAAIVASTLADMTPAQLRALAERKQAAATLTKKPRGKKAA